MRAQAVLREAGWFVRCEGEADVARLGVVLRAGMMVAASTASARCTRASTWSGACVIRITADGAQDEVRAGCATPSARRRRVAGGLAALVGAGDEGTMMDEQALMDVVDRLRNRFFGKYRGVVTDVDAATLRIKAKVPAVLADQATGWCARLRALCRRRHVGFAFLPEIGSGVWIEFEGGDVSYPIWIGCYWHDGEVPSDATAGGQGDRHQGRPQDPARRRRRQRSPSPTTTTTR